MNMTKKNRKKFANNLFRFTAPIVAVLFGQLASGVDFKAASLVAIYALYSAISDYMSKVK
ncbi:MAG: hypothetical protein ACTSQE_07435 [Candidatus Heimdallarchaeaceae archaeon]